jgi:hypothetical protein
MSYVPDFEFDIFVSYAHTDNEPLVRNGRGWVSELVDSLGKLLAQDLGRREYFEHWLDRSNLRGHEQIDGILDQVRKSATLIVVLSNAWMEASFCRKELDQFLSARGRDASSNIFVVRKNQLHDTYKAPDALQRVSGYQFWSEEEGRSLTFGIDTSSATDDARFCRKAHSVAADIARQLRALKDRRGASSMGMAATGMPRPTVLLAEVTDDIDDQRDSLRKFLEQYEIAVIPSTPYPRPGLTSQLDQDLAGCRAFVQLLGRWSGRRMDEAPRGYPWLQYERALKANVPILQWRSPELDMAILERPYRDLLELETVHAMSITQFAQETLRRVDEKLSVSAVEPRSVFIDHDRRDEHTARKIVDALCQHMDVAVPAYAGGSKAVREDRQKKMLEAESVVFLYGDVKPTWIDAELNAYRAIRAERPQPARKQIVLESPPGPKSPPSVRLKGMETLLAHEGVDEGVIDRLMSKLLH